MHLLLIRHGETDWNNEARVQGHSDTPLNANGVAQARQLAVRVAAEETFAAMYASPLARARVTAEIVAQQCGVTPILDDRLKEQMLGEFEGLTDAEFTQRFPGALAAWRADPIRCPIPGQETRDAFQRRVQSFLEDLRARHADGMRVAIVTHGGTIGMMLATLIGLDIGKRFPFWFDNASLSHVDLSGGRVRLRLLNDTCHLRNGHLQ
ncbi:MAG: histidine phosphatase family protein [Anaerolineales bacterium]|nr:histidine phosphatase family protein [Anaerolineales bacterium]